MHRCFRWLTVEEVAERDPARESSFNGCCHKGQCKEGKRDRHIDMSRAAMLASGKAFDCFAAVHDLLKPKPAAADRSDESRPAFGLHGPSAMLWRIRRQQNLSGGP